MRTKKKKKCGERRELKNKAEREERRKIGRVLHLTNGDGERERESGGVVERPRV